MMHVVLYRPLIPQNTGNIARTCAVTNSKLHLIKELGFSLDEKHLKRSGLDYWNLLDIEIHENFEAFEEKYKPQKLFPVTKFAQNYYDEADYKGECFLLFGQETKGLPDYIKKKYWDNAVKIPMIDNEHARSINLSTCVGIVLYHALHKRGFDFLK